MTITEELEQLYKEFWIKTIPELKDICKNKGIPVRASANKVEIVVGIITSVQTSRKSWRR